MALTDKEFEAGGGHEFAAEIAAGVIKHCDWSLEVAPLARGVMLNITEMMWLSESHRRLYPRHSDI